MTNVTSGIDLTVHPDSLEVPVDIANAQPLPDPLPIKKYAKFHPDSLIQIETRQATSLPTDNTEDGSVWYEVDDYFVDGKHMIIDETTKQPRHMTDVEHTQWRTEQTTVGALLHARNHRKILLDSTDWTENATMDAATKAAWQTYRQALRDLPPSIKDFDINWPTPPASLDLPHSPNVPNPDNAATGPNLNPTNGTTNS